MSTDSMDTFSGSTVSSFGSNTLNTVSTMSTRWYHENVTQRKPVKQEMFEFTELLLNQQPTDPLTFPKNETKISKQQRITELENGLREFLKLNEINQGAISALRHQITHQIRDQIRNETNSTKEFIEDPVESIMSQSALHETVSNLGNNVAAKEMELYQINLTLNENVSALQTATQRISALEQELSRLQADDEIVCQKWRETMDQNTRIQSEFTEYRKESECQLQRVYESLGDAKAREDQIQCLIVERDDAQKRVIEYKRLWIAKCALKQKQNGDEVADLKADLESNIKEVERMRNIMKRRQEKWDKEREALQQRITNLDPQRAGELGNGSTSGSDDERNKIMNTLDIIGQIAVKYHSSDSVDTIHFDEDNNLYFTNSVDDFFNVSDPLISEWNQSTVKVVFTTFVVHFASTLRLRASSKCLGSTISTDSPSDCSLIIGDLIRLRQRMESSYVQYDSISLLINKLTGDILKRVTVDIYDSISDDLKAKMITSSTIQDELYEQIYSKLKVHSDKLPMSLLDVVYLEMNRVALNGMMDILRANPIQKTTEFSVLMQENLRLKRMVNKAKEHGFDPQKLREIEEYEQCKGVIRNRFVMVKEMAESA